MSQADPSPAAARDGIVTDCSITMTWCFEDEASPLGEAAQEHVAATEAVVPRLWFVEVLNALVMGERRGRLGEARSAEFVQDLRDLPIRIDDEPPWRAAAHIVGLARAYRLSAYDAAYLELAMRKGLPLATLDDQLKAAARAVGVTLFEPPGEAAR